MTTLIAIVTSIPALDPGVLSSREESLNQVIAARVRPLNLR
jgi:hypothetical protein